MIKIPIKQAEEFGLPVLGLGTWQVGGRFERDPRSDDQTAIEAICQAIRWGLCHIDTAEVYAAGHTEELVREAIRGFDLQQLFITTKVSGDHLRYDEVIRAAQGSLERLGIKKIDLYLIHGPNPDVSLSETMRAMDFLLENELIRYIGVSNFHTPHLEEAMSYTKHRIVNNQIHYNLAARGYEENGTLEFCRSHNIMVTAYRPLAKGALTKAGIRILDEVASKYQKTPAQVALNWLIKKPNVVTIVKTSNPDHLKENLGSLGWEMEAQDERMLDENFPQGETLFA